ncbi:hypothetical protein GOP47_0003901 [Adiantum capillus-veneris]|uniref:Uncharacterized protein n=1 Tax=Adiantum capillus-veneris TaxID=13818 RepID=A0A9D4V7S3_ADICA|nr:hypothetical protein GOP47_0003901 [Adiantum capillus-veneris]
MLSCRTTGQEVASLLTAGSLHDLDVAEMAPKVLQVIQATEALKSDDILQAHDEDILVEGENFETTKPEKGTLENIKHGACTTTTTTTTTKDVSSGAEQGQELWMGASESYHVDSHLEECDRWMRGGLFVESEGETQQNMTCKTDLNSMISTVIKNGGKLSNQAGECKLDGLSKSCVYDHLKSKVQGTECGGIGIEDLVACLESQELFGQVMPNTNEKKHDKTENSLKSSLYETKVGLAEHKSLPECSFFPLHPNSSQLGSLQQPFSAMSLPPTESASFLASTEDQQKQHVASSMDMCSTAPFMLHAIQIGSIQMPIGDDDLWMPRFSPLHCIQASSLQFGQLCLPSTDQPLLMAGSNLAVVGQTPEHQKVEAEACTCVQQATDLTKNCNKVFWSPSLSSDIEQVIRPADSMETAVIQFGDLSSLVLQKQLSTGKFPLCLSHANKNSPEHQVNAELSPLSNTESNSLKGLDLPVDFAENSVVNCQQPCQNALVAGRVDKYGLAPDFGFKEQNQALLMTHQIDNAQLRLFSAFPDRKKRGNAGTCAGVSDRKYWRACTMKMKYVKVSHFMPERVLPGLEAHNNSIHRSAGKFVYKKKELPEGEKACQANQELVGNLPSDAITILQDHCSEELRACQRKSEISMYNIDAKASMLHLSKQPQFVTSEDSAMPNGVVCVFTQQGIDAPYTVDDFIEVKSRRQMLRKQRKEEDETKSGPKPCKVVCFVWYVLSKVYSVLTGSILTYVLLTKTDCGTSAAVF